MKEFLWVIDNSALETGIYLTCSARLGRSNHLLLLNHRLAPIASGLLLSCIPGSAVQNSYSYYWLCLHWLVGQLPVLRHLWLRSRPRVLGPIHRWQVY